MDPLRRRTTLQVDCSSTTWGRDGREERERRRKSDAAKSSLGRGAASLNPEIEFKSLDSREGETQSERVEV